MKKILILELLIVTVFMSCSKEVNLKGYTNFERFDEFTLKGVNPQGVNENNEFKENSVSVRNFVDSIKVYSHSKRKFYTYYKKHNYWVSRLNYYIDTDFITCYVVKTIFNDTIVDQRFSIDSISASERIQSEICVRTKFDEWGVSLSTEQELTIHEIRRLICYIKKNEIEKSKYIEEFSGHYFKKTIDKEKVTLYELPENYIDSLPEYSGYTIKQLSMILNLKRDTISSFSPWKTFSIDSISQYYIE